MVSTTDLPSVNAILNAMSATLILSGYVFIRRNLISLHRACMISAFVTSTLFLISYLTYHSLHGSTTFSGHGWLRGLYFGILISHTLLAGTIVPLVLITLYRALRGRFEQHRRIARWTFPIWLYVSVTGVVVYWMLYQLT